MVDNETIARDWAAAVGLKGTTDPFAVYRGEADIWFPEGGLFDGVGAIREGRWWCTTGMHAAQVTQYLNDTRRIVLASRPDLTGENLKHAVLDQIQTFRKGHTDSLYPTRFTLHVELDRLEPGVLDEGDLRTTSEGATYTTLEGQQKLVPHLLAASAQIGMIPSTIIHSGGKSPHITYLFDEVATSAPALNRMQRIHKLLTLVVGGDPAYARKRSQLARCSYPHSARPQPVLHHEVMPLNLEDVTSAAEAWMAERGLEWKDVDTLFDAYGHTGGRLEDRFDLARATALLAALRSAPVDILTPEQLEIIETSPDPTTASPYKQPGNTGHAINDFDERGKLSHGHCFVTGRSYRCTWTPRQPGTKTSRHLIVVPCEYNERGHIDLQPRIAEWRAKGFRNFFLNGRTGSGKTHEMAELIQSTDAGVLVTGPYKSLVGSLSARVGLPSHTTDVPEGEKPYLASPTSRGVTTGQSLARNFQGQPLRIFDELIRTADMMSSLSGANYSRDLYNLISAFRHGHDPHEDAMTLGADADIDLAWASNFADLVGEDIVFFDFSGAADNTEMIVYQSLEDIIRHIIEEVRAGTNVYVQYMGLKGQETLAETLRREFPDKRVYSMTSSNIDDPEHAGFVDNPDAWIEANQPHVLIGSPVLGTGIDISCSHFGEPCVIDRNSAHDARGIRQAVGRVRNPIGGNLAHVYVGRAHHTSLSDIPMTPAAVKRELEERYAREGYPAAMLDRRAVAYDATRIATRRVYGGPSNGPDTGPHPENCPYRGLQLLCAERGIKMTHYDSPVKEARAQYEDIEDREKKVRKAVRAARKAGDHTMVAKGAAALETLAARKAEYAPVVEGAKALRATMKAVRADVARQMATAVVDADLSLVRLGEGGSLDRMWCPKTSPESNALLRYQMEGFFGMAEDGPLEHLSRDERIEVAERDDREGRFRSQVRNWCRLRALMEDHGGAVIQRDLRGVHEARVNVDRWIAKGIVADDAPNLITPNLIRTNYQKAYITMCMLQAVGLDPDPTKAHTWTWSHETLAPLVAWVEEHEADVRAYWGALTPKWRERPADIMGKIMKSMGLKHQRVSVTGGKKVSSVTPESAEQMRTLSRAEYARTTEHGAITADMVAITPTEDSSERISARYDYDAAARDPDFLPHLKITREIRVAGGRAVAFQPFPGQYDHYTVLPT